MRALIPAVLLMAALSNPVAGAEPCSDPDDPDYGTHACKVARLRARSFTVIAAVDRGVNPYHVDFRLPPDEDLVGVHPSEFIEGYPEETPALELSLDAPELATARARDRTAWESVDYDRMTWVPGTNIIGAIGPLGGTPGDTFFDETGHGTAVSSLAAGLVHGPRSPDVLLVVVREYTAGLAWAARQPWIDVITNSWLAFASNDFSAAARESYEATSRGKIVCFASMNYAAPMIATGSQGPSWNINVGAASAATRGEHYYTGYPNDVLGLSSVQAAARDSLDGEMVFAGTSASAPNVCGLTAKTLAESREELGDHVEGPRGQTVALGTPRPGPLADGLLTRAELEDAIHATATPAETSLPDPEGDPNAIPSAPALKFVRGGYGIVDAASANEALMVLLGLQPRPERSLEDQWLQVTDDVRDAAWGDPPPSSP